MIFIANSFTAPLPRGSFFRVEELQSHLEALSQLWIDDWIESETPTSIVLCDLHSCSQYLARRGIDLAFLFLHKVPVIAIDIWDCSNASRRMDIVGDAWKPLTALSDGLAGRLTPVPIGQLTAEGAYCGLPCLPPLAKSVRRHIRQNLGLNDKDRAVMFCTAAWQHRMKDHPDGQRLTEAVPQLLWNYLEQVDASVRLIHVGPTPLPLGLAQDRYLWMPSVSPENFDRLLGSVDLFLSANISATTIGRAMMAGLPVVVVQNSLRAVTAEDAEFAVAGGMSSNLRAWLTKALPLYPFSLWPLGYWTFLRPLLRDNPYCDALHIIELLAETTFIETCQALLFNVQARQTALDNQGAYVSSVRRLPTAAQKVHEYLQ